MLFFLTLTLPALAGEPTKAQRKELNSLLDNGNITAAELEAFLGQNRPVSGDEIRATATTAVTDTFTVEVRCNLSEVIKVGKYDWVHDNIIRKNFPMPDGCTEGRTEVSLFHFGHSVSSEEVITEMDREGYCPATLPELLALGAAASVA